MKIGFIGGGNMAAAIICGLKNNGFNPELITVVDPSAERKVVLSRDFGVNVADHLNALASVDMIILAVKPQQLKTVCESLTEQLRQQVVISIAAGIRALDISNWLNQYATIIRVMPNTPAQIQAGISALFALPDVDEAQRKAANTVISAVGETLWLDDEAQMDAVTAISGSGPAYVFYMIEALEAAAMKLGLSNEHARMLALHTFAGAGQLAAQSTTDVQTLRKQVTSKGGTTEQGLLVLEAEKLKDIMYKTAKAAADQSVILGDALSS